MSKSLKSSENTDTLSVKVKEDASTDAVRYNGILITKDSYVEVDSGIKNHRGYQFLQLLSE